jgi:signal transduction histidine kinase
MVGRIDVAQAGDGGRIDGTDTRFWVSGHQGRWGWRLSDRRIRTKLALFLALPIVAILLLTGVSVTSAAGGAVRAEQARALVALSGIAGEVAWALQRERAEAALVFAAGGGTPRLDAYRQQIRAAAGVIDRYRQQRASLHPPTGFASMLRRIDGELTDLPLLRERVQSAADVTTSAVVFRYRAVVADLLTFRLTVSQVGVEAQTAGRLRAAATLSQAIESLGLAQTAVVRTLAAEQLSPAGQQEIIAATTAMASALEDFRELAPAAWRSRLTAVVAGGTVAEAERLVDIMTRAQPGVPPTLGVDAVGWVRVVAGEMDLMHTVERGIDGELRAAVAGQRDALRRTMATVGALVGAGLLVMMVVGGVVTRSLTRSLEGLRVGAEHVATTQLPELVARLDVEDVDLAAVDALVAQAAHAIPVRGGDEIGRVAAAFNTVGLRAVQVAAEQAKLRAEIRKIYMSLSRRLQRRVDTLIGHLDQLQRDEVDATRLAQLFDLDHIATLLRRLIADLQVLAGGRVGQPQAGAVALVDVFRAAQGEIEQYRRVEFGAVDAEVHIGGAAAEEFSHLLAALLDNATRFSPPNTPVTVEGRRVGDQLHVQITDVGAGMDQAQLTTVRARLTQPRLLDHDAARQMGLPVVAAIAARLRIAVEIRSAPKAGTRVNLTVPASIMAPPRQTPTPAAEAVDAPTAALPVLGAAPPAGTPPPWPLPTQPATPPPEPPRIYLELQNAWFTDRTRPGATTPGVAAGWQEAATAAAALDLQADLAAQTVTGLPVRRPGAFVVPPTPAVNHPVASPVRSSQRLRERMSAFQQGMAAGRQTHRPHPEERSW